MSESKQSSKSENSGMFGVEGIEVPKKGLSKSSVVEYYHRVKNLPRSSHEILTGAGKLEFDILNKKADGVLDNLEKESIRKQIGALLPEIDACIERVSGEEKQHLEYYQKTFQEIVADELSGDSTTH